MHWAHSNLSVRRISNGGQAATTRRRPDPHRTTESRTVPRAGTTVLVSGGLGRGPTFSKRVLEDRNPSFGANDTSSLSAVGHAPYRLALVGPLLRIKSAAKEQKKIHWKPGLGYESTACNLHRKSLRKDGTGLQLAARQREACEAFIQEPGAGGRMAAWSRPRTSEGGLSGGTMERQHWDTSCCW